MKIGIFGGSFNPIHIGHIALARQLMEQVGLGEVWFVVSPQNPHKQDENLLPEQLRLKMVEEALQDEPRMQASDVEFGMSRPSYMYNTLQKLSLLHPEHEFVLVIGGDNWQCFGRWYKYQEILSEYEVVVYPRKTMDSTPYSPHNEMVDTANAKGVTVLQMPLLDISSTMVREKIQRGESIRDMVPPCIISRLMAHYNSISSQPAAVAPAEDASAPEQASPSPTVGQTAEHTVSRVQWIDLAKGLCMLLVVWNHTRDCFQGRGLEPWSEWSYLCFYFRMPLYFVLSGLFFKTYDSPQTFLVKKTNNLLIPYATFFLVGWLILPRHITSIWFLACLFWCGVFFYVLHRITRGERWLLYLLTAVIGLGGYYLNMPHHVTHWDTALTALPFFAAGFWLRNDTQFLSSKPNYVRDSVLTVFCAVVLWLVMQKSGHGHIYYSRNIFNVHFLSLYAGGMLGTMAILLFSRMVGRLPVISHIGRYSIIVLIFHYLYLILLPDVVVRGLHGLLGWWALPLLWVALLALCIPTIWAGRQYLPYVLAQKPVLGGDYEEMKSGAISIAQSLVGFGRRVALGIVNGAKNFWTGTKNVVRSYINHTLEDE